MVGQEERTDVTNETPTVEMNSAGGRTQKMWSNTASLAEKLNEALQSAARNDK